MIAFIATLLLLSAQPSPPPPPGPEGEALLSPVREAIAQEREAQAALPPARTDSERLVRMGRLDQSWRAIAARLDRSALDPDERRSVDYALFQIGREVDHPHQQALIEMLPPEGWFLRSQYGDEASNAAFLIVQHADVDLQERFLPVLEPLAASGEVEGRAYAMMFDRVALRRDRAQRYGSQVVCENGRYVPYRLEEPNRVDELRAQLGMNTMAENLTRFSGLTC